MTARPTPTPMPAWAPVERPEEEEETGGMVEVEAGAGPGARPGLLERMVWVGLADVETVLARLLVALPSSAVVVGAGVGALAVKVPVADCGALPATVKGEGLPLLSMGSAWCSSPNFGVSEVPKVRSTEYDESDLRTPMGISRRSTVSMFALVEEGR